MSARRLNLLVFRDGRRIVSGQELRSALFQQLGFLLRDASSEFGEPGPPETDANFAGCNDKVLNALLRAGELECAAVDGGLPPQLFQPLTDLLAEALLNPERLRDLLRFDLPANEKFSQSRAALEAVYLPESLSVSAPEGFAYYGLHPLAFADVLE